MVASNALMDASGVLNALGLAGILVFFLSPTFVVIMGICIVRKVKLRSRLRKAAAIQAEKQTETNIAAQPEMQSAAKQRIEIALPQEENTKEVIQEIRTPTQQNRMCESMALEFDEKGSIKK